MCNTGRAQGETVTISQHPKEVESVLKGNAYLQLGNGPCSWAPLNAGPYIVVRHFPFSCSVDLWFLQLVDAICLMCWLAACRPATQDWKGCGPVGVCGKRQK